MHKGFDGWGFNPLPTELYLRNMNIYLHFMSLLNNEMVQEAEIVPHGRSVLHNQYHGCWLPGNTRSQGIRGLVMDLFCRQYRIFLCTDNKNSDYGLVTPYGVIDQGQYWFRQWVVAWLQQVISWTNVDSPSMGFCSMHMRAILQVILGILIHMMSLKSTLLTHLPLVPRICVGESHQHRFR